MATTSAQMKEYHRTFKGRLTLIWNGQKKSAREAGRAAPTYTKKELSDWIQNQPNFEQLWINWVQSNYDKFLTPSIDRKNNKVSYTLDNIQLVTWKENLTNQKIQNKSGEHINSLAKQVIKLTLDGVYLETFPSIMCAFRTLVNARSPSKISSACAGKIPTAYGYKWQWA